MDILWNEDKIPNYHFNDAIVHDNEGGIADSLDLILTDPEEFWLQWNPGKGDLIQINADGFHSGKMYYDGYDISASGHKLMALSIPHKAKSQDSKSWEKISFITLANELCGLIGLSLKTYDITNYTYSRVEQKDEEGYIGLLNRLCLREGYSLKVNDGKAVIFNEKKFENQTPDITIKRSDFVSEEYRFLSVSAQLASACVAKYGNIEYTYEASGVYGPKITLMDEPFYDLSEAQRYAKNKLRHRNKNESLGYFPVKFNPGLAAGITINLTGLGSASGTWYIKRVDHSKLNDVSHVFVRRAIEGDY